jgi:hypothetical protein
MNLNHLNILQDTALKVSKFCVEIVENYYKDKIAKGFLPDNFTQRYFPNGNMKLFYLDEIAATFNFSSKIVEIDGRFEYVTSCDLTDYIK